MASHTIDLLEHAIEVAKQAQVHVRTDWLDGMAGGLCRIGKQNWLFLDMSLSAADQLAQVSKALRSISLNGIEVHPELKRLLA